MLSVRLTTPLTKASIARLNAGDKVYLSGTIYTLRDASCRIINDLTALKKKLPVSLEGEVIYFAGPTPAVKDMAIGSIGPTTTSRMGSFLPLLFRKRIISIIGKGRLSEGVKKSIKRSRAVYFLAVGGAGAVLSQHVKKADVVAFKHLGTEAIHRLEIRDFPLIVGVDSKGRDIYDKIPNPKS